MAKKPDKKKEPEAPVDFPGVLKPEDEAWLVRLSPYIQDDIPEYIFKAIEAHFQDPKLPAPDLLEQLIAWETTDKLLPPIVITSLKIKVEKRFPGLIKETIKRRAGQGEGKGKETLSAADIRSDSRVSISKAWFSRLKKKIPLPPSDEVKDHGEAWTDGENIINMIMKYRKLHPRKPPQRTATTILKRRTQERKK